MGFLMTPIVTLLIGIFAGAGIFGLIIIIRNNYIENKANKYLKEVKEEAGLDVTADRVIAVQDREKHNLPIYAYKVCKIFMLCEVEGGVFKENSETIGFDYFTKDNLPILATEKNNEEQIQMCFDAYKAGEKWKTYFD